MGERSEESNEGDADVEGHSGRRFYRGEAEPQTTPGERSEESEEDVEGHLGRYNP